MIGTLDSSCKEATVVGAGIAGMLAAYSLDRRGYRVTLLYIDEKESEERDEEEALEDSWRVGFGRRR